MMAEEKEETVRWKDLPEAVQKTIKANAQGGIIEEIEKETEDGKVVYEAEVELKDGRELEIEVAEDGTLIEIEEDDGLRHTTGLRKRFSMK